MNSKIDKLVFESEHLIVKAFLSDNYDKCLFVTFCSLTEKPSINRNGFGENFFKKQQIDVCHVITGKNDWYQSPHILPALDAIKAIASKYKFVVTYGSSMGGYAALNFAPYLKARRVIALAPQRSIDRQHVPFETRWKNEAEKITFLYDFMHETTIPGCRSFVFFDPFYKPDKLHIQAIKQLRNCEFIKLPFSGHSHGIPPTILQEAIHCVIAEIDQDLPTVIQATYREVKKSMGSYFYNIVKSCPQLAIEKKLALLLKAVNISSHDHTIHIHLAKTLMSANRLDEALYILKTQSVIRSTDSRLFNLLATLLNRMGKYEEALAFSNQAIQHANEEPIFWNQNATLHLSLGNLEYAETSGRKAIQFAPKVAQYHRQLGIILLKAGKSKQALEAVQHAIKLDESSAPCWYSYAEILANRQDWQNASKAANKAFELEPKSSHYAFHASRFFEKIGDLGKASELAKSAAALNPANANLVSRSQRLEKTFNA